MLFEGLCDFEKIFDGKVMNFCGFGFFLVFDLFDYEMCNVVFGKMVDGGFVGFVFGMCFICFCLLFIVEDKYV